MKKGQVIKFMDYSYMIPKVNKGIYIRTNKFNKDVITIKVDGCECYIFKTQVID